MSPKSLPLHRVPLAIDRQARQQLYVFGRRCKGCLFGKNRLIPEATAAALVQNALREETHFTCHVSSLEQRDVMCRGFYDEEGNQLLKVRLAQHIDLVVEVEQPPYPVEAAAALEREVRAVAKGGA